MPVRRSGDLAASVRGHADFDTPGHNAHGKRAHRFGDRGLAGGARLDVERALVQRALDAAVLDPAVGQLGGAMVYQRLGSAWQKLCTALAGLPAA